MFEYRYVDRMYVDMYVYVIVDTRVREIQQSPTYGHVGTIGPILKLSSWWNNNPVNYVKKI